MAIMRSAGRAGLVLVAGLAVFADAMPSALACGAYFARRIPTTVGAANAQLYNHSTKMVVARADDTSTITMTADYRGDPKEFAVVIAVPTVLTREQIKIADGSLIERLDKETAPKLVESFDPSPCPSTTVKGSDERLRSRFGGAVPPASARAPLGVTVEAQYVVGEYDVAILSAVESDGLQTWLDKEGYNVPPAAKPVLAQYIADGMKFFVAKVNLQQQQQLGYAMLRPLQINYQSPKFLVPIRLSTINSEGPQEMFIFLLTRHGRVEAANYRTYAMPTDIEVPPFVKKDFPGFYRAIFDRLAASSKGRGVFTEHVSVDARRRMLQDDQLAELGATWIRSDAGARENVVLTRLHVRYDAEHFRTDLMMRETRNRTSVSGEFRINHPYEGDMSCPAGERYRAQVAARRIREIANVSRVTGWSRTVIEQKAAGG